MALPERFKRLVPLGVAALVGLIAVGLMQQYLRQKEQVLERELQRVRATYPEPVPVVVAASDVEAGVVLNSSHVTTADVPERFFQPYAVRNPHEVFGMVTVAPIAEGEQVLLNKVRRPEDVPLGSTLSGLLPQGKRAVTIGVDSLSGVGGFVQPGDTVDILWTITVPMPDQSDKQMVTWTLFQDVPVVGVGDTLMARSAGRAAAEESYTVTLSLNPQETSFLLFARDQGRIQLSLRSRFEEGPVPLAPANIQNLLEKQLGLKAPPSAAKPPGHRVEIYKGLKRDVVTLPGEQQQQTPSGP